MDQAHLFHDDIHAAAWVVVKATGGPAAVAMEMRPELEGQPEKAGRWLADCLNPDRAEKLTGEQWVWLARRGKRHGIHDLMWQFCRDSEYHDASPKDLAVEREKVRGSIEDHIGTLGRLIGQLKELDALNRDGAQ